MRTRGETLAQPHRRSYPFVKELVSLGLAPLKSTNTGGVRLIPPRRIVGQDAGRLAPFHAFAAHPQVACRSTWSDDETTRVPNTHCPASLEVLNCAPSFPQTSYVTIFSGFEHRNHAPGARWSTPRGRHTVLNHVTHVLQAGSNAFGPLMRLSECFVRSI